MDEQMKKRVLEVINHTIKDGECNDPYVGSLDHQEFCERVFVLKKDIETI